jgi:predicted dehydrogenase
MSVKSKKKPIEILVIGAGSRGMYTYGELIKREDINARIVAVADPSEEKRKKMAEEHAISVDRCFEDGLEALSKDKFCDAVLIATPDRTHHTLAIKALEKGYSLLLEKPMASNPSECVDILKAQKRVGNLVSVCHVLRYAPFFQEMKKLLDSPKLGKVLSVDLLEEIGYWHFAHSYVRGNWRKKKTSGPVILTKSCHDLDILTWLMESDVSSIASSGSLKYFRKANAPDGSKPRCIEDCMAKSVCPYNAERFYLNPKDPSEVKWPQNVISPVDKSLKARKKAITQGPYGRCVFGCDNDVCDNQEVLIRFRNGVKARFTLVAFGSNSTRKIRFYLENGEIHGDLSQGSIRVVTYKGSRGGDPIKKIEVSGRGGHGGGDEYLIKGFVKTLEKGDPQYNLTSAEMSLQGHLMCFAAEESRMRGKPVNFQTYKKKLGLK